MKIKHYLAAFVFSVLVAGCSEDKEEPTPVTPIPEETILVFTDVEFSNQESSDTFGRFFSISEGKVFKENELDGVDAGAIDLVFGNIETPVNYFDSPSEYEVITNGKTVKVTNYVTDEFSVAEFESMEDDSSLKDLEIIHDNESFPSDYDGVVLFETEAGKKGVIKVKAYNAERILVDIKVQK